MARRWHPSDPALDAASPREPDVSYVVCSTPRCGSGLLCHGLISTGRAGTPAEYLHEEIIAQLSDRWGCGTDLAAYAAELRARRTGENGVFGVKVHWNQLAALQRRTGDPEILSALVPGARLVRIRRRDLDAQAVSYWVALFTGVWHEQVGFEPRRRRRVPYDYAGIEQRRRVLISDEEHWDAYLEAHGAAAIDVVYEDLSADHGGEVARVLGELVPGEAGASPGVPESRLRRQGGDRSQAMLERYRRDRERHGGGPGRPTVRTRLRHARRSLATRLR